MNKKIKQVAHIKCAKETLVGNAGNYNLTLQETIGFGKVGLLLHAAFCPSFKN